jgi:hypothetical protein
MKILASIFILFFSYGAAFGCTCANVSESQRIETVKNAKIVFLGEVVSISQPSRLNFVDVEFKVIRAWKGVDSARVVFKTYDKSSSCSVNYQVGQTAYVLADGNPPQTNYCSSTLIDFNRISEALGEGKTFEDFETTESFWSGIWRNIVSFFS